MEAKPDPRDEETTPLSDNQSNVVEQAFKEVTENNEGNTSDDVAAALTPEVKAAVESFFAEPFPEKPYALIPVGGERTPEFADYVIHKDLETENQCVFIFDSIVDAFAVAEEYKEATGKEAEPVPCDIYSLEEDRFWVKFYRASGVVAIMSLADYKARINGGGESDEDDADDEDNGGIGRPGVSPFED